MSELYGLPRYSANPKRHSLQHCIPSDNGEWAKVSDVEILIDMLFTRTSPLASLTDEEWWDLYAAMDDASANSMKHNQSLSKTVANAGRAWVEGRKG